MNAQEKELFERLSKRLDEVSEQNKMLLVELTQSRPRTNEKNSPFSGGKVTFKREGNIVTLTGYRPSDIVKGTGAVVSHVEDEVRIDLTKLASLTYTDKRSGIAQPYRSFLSALTPDCWTAVRSAFRDAVIAASGQTQFPW